MEDNNPVDDFDVINPDETDLNENSKSAFEIMISHPSNSNAPRQKSFSENLYEKYHGSSPRFPGGNCVFASILTFMSYEKIDNMIKYVLTKQKELDNEQLNDIIVQIFKNTPRTKNRDIISYMRAYVYIYLVENLHKDFKIGGTNSQLTNLVNGGYTFIDKYTMQAFCEMTGTNILVFKNSSEYNPILCSVKNNVYSDNSINIFDNNENRNEIENFASSLQTGRNETDQTVNPSKFNNEDTISIFCFGRHCTPFVTDHSSKLAAFFNSLGATILANLFSLFNFLKPRLGAKEINTQRINNFVPRDFIMKKQFDGVKIKQLILKFPKNLSEFFSKNNSFCLNAEGNSTPIKLNKLEIEDDNYYCYEAQDVTIKNDKLLFKISSNNESSTYSGFKTELHFSKNINEYEIKYNKNDFDPNHIKTIKISKLDWKTILAISAGTIFALSVAVVSALTFGLPLISLFVAKIVIPIVAALAIATFIYGAAKSIKNAKEQSSEFMNTNGLHLITQAEMDAEMQKNSCWHWFRKKRYKDEVSPKLNEDNQKYSIP